MYLLLTGVILFLFYYYATRNHNYWKKRGIKYENPLPLIGGLGRQFIDKVSLYERYSNLYKQYPNEKFVGFFEGNSQGLVVRDPEIIKRILVTDFRSFHLRGITSHKEIVSNLEMNIFTLDGDYWKLLRQKLTPMFSSGKLKAMFPLITERLEKLLIIAEGLAKTGAEVDTRELMARYTTDFIGACGFGIDADTLNKEDSDFRKLGKNIFTMTKGRIIAMILRKVFPNMKADLIPTEITEQTTSLVKEIMCQRGYKPGNRNDFIDLLLQLKQNEKIIGESLDKRDSNGQLASVELNITDSLLVAQAFIFFAAGFETSSSSSSFLLHMLAYHPDEQIRCQQEIDEVLKKYDGVLSFDAVREMKYLEMALREALRILPPAAFLFRKSVTKYTFPGTNLTIDKDTAIIIPTEALHNDEKYFEKPEEFRPQRFHPDKEDKIRKFVYLPFGDGPRACIGERMGLMQVLAGVAAILSKFSVAPSKNSVFKPRIDYKSGFVPLVVGGLPLSLKHR